jgi:hypothetical protein
MLIVYRSPTQHPTTTSSERSTGSLKHFPQLVAQLVPSSLAHCSPPLPRSNPRAKLCLLESSRALHSLASLLASASVVKAWKLRAGATKMRRKAKKKKNKKKKKKKKRV